MASGPLTDDERDNIAQRLQAGESYGAIAKATGRGKATVARVARSIGYSSEERSALARTRAATVARSAFCAERRAAIASRATERAEELLESLTKARPTVVGDEVLELEPDARAVRDLASAIGSLTKVVLDIDRHDNRADEGASAVDAWLRSIVGEAAGV